MLGKFAQPYGQSCPMPWADTNNALCWLFLMVILTFLYKCSLNGHKNALSRAFFTLETTYRKCLREEWGKLAGYQLLSSFWLKMSRTSEDRNMTSRDGETLPIRNLCLKWGLLTFGRMEQVTNNVWIHWLIVSYWWVTWDFWWRNIFALFCCEMRSKKRLFMY